MPFEFRNKPGKFQRILDGMLSLVKWQFVLVGLDIIVILFKSPEQHQDHVRKL